MMMDGLYGSWLDAVSEFMLPFHFHAETLQMAIRNNARINHCFSCVEIRVGNPFNFVWICIIAKFLQGLISDPSLFVGQQSKWNTFVTFDLFSLRCEDISWSFSPPLHWSTCSDDSCGLHLLVRGLQTFFTFPAPERVEGGNRWHSNTPCSQLYLECGQADYPIRRSVHQAEGEESNLIMDTELTKGCTKSTVKRMWSQRPSSSL